MKRLRSQFITELTVRQIDPEWWQLTTPLVYASNHLNAVVTVPVGFRTDFASVPRLPFAYSAFGNVAQKAAVIHDQLYADPKISRSDADAVFCEAMAVLEVPWWRRKTMWLGVRLFGWLYKDNVTEKRI